MQWSTDFTCDSCGKKLEKQNEVNITCWELNSVGRKQTVFFLVNFSSVGDSFKFRFL